MARFEPAAFSAESRRRPACPSRSAGSLPLLRFLDHLAIIAEQRGEALGDLRLQLVHLLFLAVGKVGQIAEGRIDGARSQADAVPFALIDRKSTRLNSSH